MLPAAAAVSPAAISGTQPRTGKTGLGDFPRDRFSAILWSLPFEATEVVSGQDFDGLHPVAGLAVSLVQNPTDPEMYRLPLTKHGAVKGKRKGKGR